MSLTKEKESKIRGYLAKRLIVDATDEEIIQDLVEEIDALRADYFKQANEYLKLRQERDSLSTQIDKLYCIIAQQLSENDELGAEFAYVRALKMENSKIREMLAESVISRCHVTSDKVLSEENALLENLQSNAKDTIRVLQLKEKERNDLENENKLLRATINKISSKLGMPNLDTDK